MSVVVVATIVPEPAHRDEVIAAVERAIARVHLEEGCDLYALNEAPDRLVMVEKWRDQGALDRHGRGEALRELNAALDGRLAKPTEVVVLAPHPAGTPEQGAV